MLLMWGQIVDKVSISNLEYLISKNNEERKGERYQIEEGYHFYQIFFEIRN